MKDVSAIIQAKIEDSLGNKQRISCNDRKEGREKTRPELKAKETEKKEAEKIKQTGMHLESCMKEFPSKRIPDRNSDMNTKLGKQARETMLFW